MIENRDGLWWPSTDCIGRPIIEAELAAALPVLLEHTERRGVCVQAGGNVGLWPKALAEHFRAVYTFEPNWVPFRCLMRNVTEENVYPFRAGLGHLSGGASMTYEPFNYGGAALSGEGDIRVLSVDSLDLPALDLLLLDIEGFELHALMGAEKSIAKYKPVISVELRNLAVRYNPHVTDDVIRGWITKRGYTLAAKTAWDEIYCALQS